MAFRRNPWRAAIVVSRALALCVAFAAVAISLAGRLAAEGSAADAFNHFTPIWFVLGLMACGALFWRPGWARWLGLAAAAAVLATSGAALVVDAGQAPSRGQASVRIVQFNAYKQNAAPDRAARWIRDQRPDFVVLEEAALDGGRVRDALLAGYPHVIDCLSAQTRCSTVIMSRRAPVDGAGLAQGDPENQRALSAAWMRFETAAGGLTLLGVHFNRPWPYSEQADDLRSLSLFVGGVNREEVILVGDFNQTPWTRFTRSIGRTLGLQRVRSAGGTWPALGVPTPLRGVNVPAPPILPIDQVFTGRRWQVVSIRRGPELGSDHRPLVIDLAERR